MDKLNRLDGSTNIKDFPELYNGNISTIEDEVGKLNDGLSSNEIEISQIKTDFNIALNKIRAEYTYFFDALDPDKSSTLVDKINEIKDFDDDKLSDCIDYINNMQLTESSNVDTILNLQSKYIYCGDKSTLYIIDTGNEVVESFNRLHGNQYRILLNPSQDGDMHSLFIKDNGISDGENNDNIIFLHKNISDPNDVNYIEIRDNGYLDVYFFHNESEEKLYAYIISQYNCFAHSISMAGYIDLSTGDQV